MWQQAQAQSEPSNAITEDDPQHGRRAQRNARVSNRRLRVAGNEPATWDPASQELPNGCAAPEGHVGDSTITLRPLACRVPQGRPRREDRDRPLSPAADRLALNTATLGLGRNSGDRRDFRILLS